MKAAAALAVFGLILAATPSFAETSFGAPVSDAQLDENRGGFITADGFTFQFGAIVRTFVDGVMALESTVNWSGTGVTTEQTRGPAASGDMQLANLDGSQMGSISLGQITGSVVDLGGTVVAHNITAGQITNIVVNTADYRNITQDTQLNLLLPGFASVQAGAALASLGTRLHDDAAFANSLSGLR